MEGEPQKGGTDMEGGGLKVPSKQPKKGRLWLNDGSCIRLRPEYRDHVWSYDFVAARTSDGKAFRILTVIDEHARECLAMVVKQSITSQDVLERLYMLFLVRESQGTYAQTTARSSPPGAVRGWLSDLGVKAMFIEPGSPWENGMSSHSTGSSGMNSSTGRCLAP